MPRNDDIYKILIDYIQDDNKWKSEISTRISSIETQTKATNGRLLKVEEITKDYSETEIKSQVNWKWIMTILTGLQFLITTGFYLAIDWVKKHII